MIDARRIFKQPELSTDRGRIRSPGREQKEPGVARSHQNTALVAICLAQPEQFVECYRTLQIGYAHTDVVESFHHVRWFRLFRRPVAKTSESSSAPTIEASTSTEIVNAVTTRTTSENGVKLLIDQASEPKEAKTGKQGGERRQLSGGLALNSPTVTLAWLFICRRSHSTQCKLAAATPPRRRAA